MELHIVDLRAAGRFDARTVLDGPIRDVQVHRLTAGESLDLVAAGVEYTAFVLAGDGTATDGTTRIPLAAGVGVTVPLGGRLRVAAAGGAPLELFTACLAVDEEAGRDHL